MAAVLSLPPGDLTAAYLIAGAVAGVVGFADIITRYKDNPWRAVATFAAWIYIIVNVGFGVTAYWLAMVLGAVDVGELRLPDEPGLTDELVTSGLVVGFGAILILRAVAFKLAIGGQDNALGPSTIVDALLAACDQWIDRDLAHNKDKRVREMMSEVSYASARVFIPQYGLALLQQNEERVRRLADFIAGIDAYKKDDGGLTADAERAFLFGNALINMFGYEVAKGVVDGFRKQLSLSLPAPPPPPVSPPPPAAN